MITRRPLAPLVLGLTLLLPGCSTTEPTAAVEPPPAATLPDNPSTGATPQYELPSVIGNRPYRSGSAKYTVLSPHSPYQGQGRAISFPAMRFGKKAVNGETIDPKAFIAGHRRLSLPSYVKVTRPSKPGYVVVRVIDRGPFPDNQGEILLSPAALSALGVPPGEKPDVAITLIPVSPTGHYALPDADPNNTPAPTEAANYIQIMASTDFKQLQQQGQHITQDTQLPHRLVPGKTAWRLLIGPLDPAQLAEWLQHFQQAQFPSAFPTKAP